MKRRRHNNRDGRRQNRFIANGRRRRGKIQAPNRNTVEHTTTERNPCGLFYIVQPLMASSPSFPTSSPSTPLLAEPVCLTLHLHKPASHPAAELQCHFTVETVTPPGTALHSGFCLCFHKSRNETKCNDRHFAFGA